MSADWSYTGLDGTELRVMRLPDRKALYLVLVDDDGMHCVARTLGDREATALVAFLDQITGSESESEPLGGPELPSDPSNQAQARRRAAEGRKP